MPDVPAPVPQPNPSVPEHMAVIQIVADVRDLSTMQIMHPDDRIQTIDLLAAAQRRLIRALVKVGNKGPDSSPVKVATAADMPPTNGNGHEPGANRLRLHK